MTLLEELQRLPDHWAFVAIGPNKRPYIQGWDWAEQPMTKAQMAEEITAGRAKAIGVVGGPASGGILFVDHDGISATNQLERLGLPPRKLPKSWAFTSGRNGRFQIAYLIPEEFWPALRNRRFWHTGDPDPVTGKPTKVLGPDGKAEQIDFRWARHYSIIAGSHPETTGYRWLVGYSPADLELATAPLNLIELLLRDEPQPDAPLLTAAPNPAAAAATRVMPPSPAGGPLPLLDFICKASRELIEAGGTPGSWNDDQLRLALDLQGTEEWIRAQGHQPDITAAQAFELHIQAASSKSRDFDERKARRRFDGAAERTPRPSTPPEKLQERLRFHTRHTAPILPPPPKRTGPQANNPESPETSSPRQQQDQQPYAPSFSKPIKLEAGEVLAMLRHQAAGGRLRYNTFSQQIELDGAVIDGAERFYLLLADQGFKVGKELCMDCLIQIAHEHPYDPVRLYLEHVEATVDPAYIGGLASAYLRPEDARLEEPTLYDHMLRCTLIGAVRRAFEPGWKHDTATVLMGDQGQRKSSFWNALGGPFFSDALGDCSSKDDLMILHRSWIMEWAELDHVMGRKHAGQIKSFLSQATDLFRVPYGKVTESFPRRGIIVGSTNRQTGFLVDDTGNRRFWIIPVTRTQADPIDTGTLMAERDAIWAGAVAAYRAGELNYLPHELAQLVNTENEAYQVSNPWEPAIAQWLAQRIPGEPITTERILLEAVEKPTERQTRADQMAVADMLRAMGFERRRTMQGGQRTWRWFSTG
jgi:predicted P-loop ATPase